MMETLEATKGLSTRPLHLWEHCVLPPDWKAVSFLKVLLVSFDTRLDVGHSPFFLGVGVGGKLGKGPKNKNVRGV